jgi:hypothetical protein
VNKNFEPHKLSGLLSALPPALLYTKSSLDRGRTDIDEERDDEGEDDADDDDGDGKSASAVVLERMGAADESGLLSQN